MRRSYGDSTPVTLTETTTLEDGLAVMEWVKAMFKDRTNIPSIVLWGHSLGTSIASRTLASLETSGDGNLVSGLILESPFNKMKDELKHFKTVTWTSWLLGLVR